MKYSYSTLVVVFLLLQSSSDFIERPDTQVFCTVAGLRRVHIYMYV